AGPQAARIMLAAISTERVKYKRFMGFSSRELASLNSMHSVSRPGLREFLNHLLQIIFETYCFLHKYLNFERSKYG
ncbi:MAG: hypothetical protein NTW99_05040, partial [Chloroflexi bacterium]|nr:hypothetical protein [Chloroflexota bacterium]